MNTIIRSYKENQKRNRSALMYYLKVARRSRRSLRAYSEIEVSSQRTYPQFEKGAI